MMTAKTPIATAAAGIDVKIYGRLLVKFAPKAIETEAENKKRPWRSSKA